MEVPPLQKDKLHAFLTSFCREKQYSLCLD